MKVYAEFDDCKAGLKKMNSDSFGKRHSWVPTEKSEDEVRIKSNRNSSPVIKRTQISLMLAWAWTVHIVQGLRLPQIVVSFQLLKQSNFNY